MADEDENTARQRATPGEWVVGTIGGLVVVALLAFLGYQAVARDEGPRLSTTVADIYEVGDHYAVEVRVDNDGGATAASVGVTGQVVRDDGAVLGTASATLPYVPARSRRDVTLVLPVDPSEDGVELGVSVSGFVTQ